MIGWLLLVGLAMAPPDSAVTDSLQRWGTHWSIAEWEARLHGAVSAHLGGYLRPDAVWLDGQGPQARRFRVDGLDWADPVTGWTNPHRLPHRQTEAWTYRSTGLLLETDIRIKDYRVTRPFTWIDYDQAAYDRLSTDVTLAANASTRTGYALRYWGKNDNGEHAGRVQSGRYLMARAWHETESGWRLTATGHFNGLQTSEPGGYTLFDYIPEASVPNDFAGRASVRQRVVQLTAEKDAWRLGLHQSDYRRFYKSTTDTTFWRYRGAGAYLDHTTARGRLRLDSRLAADAWFTDPERDRSLPVAGWTRLHAAQVMTYRFFRAGYDVETRSRGGTAAWIHAGVDLGWAQVTAATGSRHRGLLQAPITLTRLDAAVQAFGLRFGAHADNRNEVGGSAAYTHTGATWEWGAGSTVQARTDDSRLGPRYWNRANIHWKGYLFNRATYVKTGFTGTWVPLSYRAPTYDPAMDHWTAWNPASALIPAFMRLDWDLSARVRNAFVIIRWEHLNQNAGQFGYQEVAGYPMPGRQLRFGLRVILRD